MPLHIRLDTARPELPDSLAHEANEHAVRAEDARENRLQLIEDIKKEKSHPIQGKFTTSLHGYAIVSIGMMAIAYLAVLPLEYYISRDIYEVVFHYPWLPFVFCVLTGLYISACIGEATPLAIYNVRPESQSGPTKYKKAIDHLYDTHSEKTHSILFHPVAGVILAAIFLAGIYKLSQYRVNLETLAGEAPSPVTVYLPTILFGFELVMGIALVWSLVMVLWWLRIRSMRTELTRLRNGEITIREAARSTYMDYIREWKTYNTWARDNGKPDLEAVPANSALNKIVNETLDADVQSPAARAKQEIAPSSEPEATNNQEGQQRVDDLIDILDTNIDSANKNI